MAAIREDLMTLPNGDLDLGAETLRVVPSDDTHISNMFIAAPGSWKQFLQNGINANAYLKSTGNALLVLKKEARRQLTADGYIVRDIIINSKTTPVTIQPDVTR